MEHLRRGLSHRWAMERGGGIGMLAVLLALAFGLFLAGCAFPQPDFSTGAGVTEPAASSSAPARPGEPEPAGSFAEALAREIAVGKENAPAEESRILDSARAVEGGPEPAGGKDGALTPAQQGDSPADPYQPPWSEMDAVQVVAAHEQVLQNIYKKALPSVVFIRTARNMGAMPGQDSRTVPGWPEEFFRRSGGSGFVWDNRGHVVTNHHVVAGADRVTVILSDGTEMEAEVLGTDPDSDLAALKVIDRSGKLAPVTLGHSGRVNVGQIVAALGNPFGQQFSITSGIISAVGRVIRSDHSPFSIPEVLQTDAPINPGNSGGPLLDRKGDVIGVNTLIISRTGVSSGIGFAVPIDIAKLVIPALIEEGHFYYSWLGISGANLNPDMAEAMGLPRDTRGALVIDIAPGGPAAKAELRGSDGTLEMEGLELPVGGDVITAIDGNPVQGISDVIAYLVSNTRPDQKIVLEVLREGEPVKVEVTLGTRPGSV